MLVICAEQNELKVDYKISPEACLPAQLPYHLNHHPLPGNKTVKTIEEEEQGRRGGGGDDSMNKEVKETEN